MKKTTPKGMFISGSFRRAGMTFYFKQGQMIARVSRSMERRSCTLPQFVGRQKMRHSVALWQMLKWCKPMFTRHKTAYQGFLSLANQLPPVFVPKQGPTSEASLLMPDLPVSDGTLPAVRLTIGETGGKAALFTNLTASDMGRNEELVLYTAEQNIDGATPRVCFAVRKVSPDELTEVEGWLALVDDTFADTMKGWALVRVDGERCSQQGLVTRCTYYEAFTTEEALQAAAKSYGGLTGME